MEVTEPYSDKNREVVGYMLNTGLSRGTASRVADIQDKLVEKWGQAVYCPPYEALHVTLMDWIAPLVDYGRKKHEIFRQVYPGYDRVFQKVIEDISPIKVSFDEIHVSTGAIYIIGNDQGQFRDIREGFLGQVELLPDTKRPPTIIHSTIARFNEALELERIKEFVDNLEFSAEETIKSFRLVKETRIPMLDYALIKNYALEGK